MEASPATIVEKSLDGKPAEATADVHALLRDRINTAVALYKEKVAAHIFQKPEDTEVEAE